MSNRVHLSLLLLLAIGAVATSTTTTTITAFASNNGNNNNDGDTEEEATDNNNNNKNNEEEAENDDEAATAAANEPNDPTPGIGNNDNPLGQDNPQSDRVGSHDSQTSPESNPGGTVTDPTLCDITDNPDCSTTVDKNCFGKVISERAQDHKDEPEEGTLGSHSRDPVPELEGNETPRQGIGNQDQGHPSAHGAFNSQFEEEDEQNVIDNC